MQVCKYLRIHIYASMQLCKYASICKYASMQVCKYVSIHIYMQVCKYSSMHVYAGFLIQIFERGGNGPPPLRGGTQSPRRGGNSAEESRLSIIRLFSLIYIQSDARYCQYYTYLQSKPINLTIYT